MAIAICLFVAGMIFGLNGDQWAWWTWASWAGALLVLVGAGFGGMQIAGSGRDRPAGVVGALLGAALIVGTLWLMAHSYSDPYSGDLFWPHALAVLAFVGLALVVVGLLSGGRRHRAAR